MSNLSVISNTYTPSNVTKIGENALSIMRERPVRRVFGGCSNVNVRFASSKMKCVIQAESRTVEYLFVLACEMDDEIIEYWDQPLRIKLSYLDLSGRKRGNLHTPDFCIITKDQVYLVECKSESQLIKLSQKNPEKFCKDEEGQWISPAGKAAAKEYGFDYKVYTPKSFSSVFARNCEFLIDYVSSDIPDELQETTQKVKSLVESEKILNLKKLLSLVNSPEAVYYAIAKKLITFDWFNDLVVRPEISSVYDSFVTKSIQKNSTPSSSSQLITLKPGDKFSWNKKIWTVLDINNVITAQDVQLNIVELKSEDVIKLINSGKISLSNSDKEHDNLLKSVLMETSNAEFEVALNRLEFIRNNKGDIPDRTFRRWKKLYNDAENMCGIGLIGLLPKTKKRGNKSDRISDSDLEHLTDSIEKHYEKSSPHSAYGAYGKYKKSCVTKGFIAVSYKTYLKVIHNRDKYNLTKKRHGKKAAYQIKNQHQLPENCDTTAHLPPQGDRAFEVAHIDHTQLEIELESSITGDPLGRPWLTILINGYSRLVLAYWLTFEPPSSRSVMMVLRRCVERFNRLPQKIVFDRGAEFQSVYLEVLLASYYVTKIDRTASEPRDGSVVERNFLTTQTKFIHMLTGNTSNRRLERGLSATHEPSDLAIWTPDEFEQKLKEWLYEIYPLLPHKGLADKPKRLLICQHFPGHFF